MKYAVVFEKADQQLRRLRTRLAGMRRHGQNADDVERIIREAIAFHIEGRRRQGEAVPEPVTWAELVDV